MLRPNGDSCHFSLMHVKPHGFVPNKNLLA